MAVDFLLSLTGGVRKNLVSGTNNETAVDIKGRTTIRKPLWARIRYYAAQNASGSNSVVFKMQQQVVDITNTATYVDKSVSNPIDLSTTIKSGVIHVAIVGMGGTRVSGANNIRLSAVMSGAGSGPTIQYIAEITDSLG